jgi:hypothetical protein
MILVSKVSLIGAVVAGAERREKGAIIDRLREETH